MKNIWRRFAAHFQFRTLYVRELEEEIARLRAENRAILNSVLGIAGIPPLRVATTPRAGAAPGASRKAPLRNFVRASPSSASQPDASIVRSRLASPERHESRPGAVETPNPETSAQFAPLRRRSWQQAVRVREIEDARAARRARETDTATFPPPRNAVVREL